MESDVDEVELVFDRKSEKKNKNQGFRINIMGDKLLLNFGAKLQR